MFNHKQPNMYTKIAFEDLALLKKDKFGELPEIIVLAPSHKNAYGIKTGKVYALAKKESNQLYARDEFNTPVGTISEDLNPFNSFAPQKNPYGQDILSTPKSLISNNELIKAKIASEDLSKKQTTTLLDVQILQREIDNKMTEWLRDSRNSEAIVNKGKKDIEESRDNYSYEFGLK